MPFGALAGKAAEVYFSSRGMARVATVGYEAVLSRAATMPTSVGQQWREVMLPGLSGAETNSVTGPTRKAGEGCDCCTEPASTLFRPRIERDSYQPS
jgi:hypothetical protein